MTPQYVEDARARVVSRAKVVAQKRRTKRFGPASERALELLLDAVDELCEAERRQKTVGALWVVVRAFRHRGVTPLEARQRKDARPATYEVLWP